VSGPAAMAGASGACTARRAPLAKPRVRLALAAQGCALRPSCDSVEVAKRRRAIFAIWKVRGAAGGPARPCRAKPPTHFVACAFKGFAPSRTFARLGAAQCAPTSSLAHGAPQLRNRGALRPTPIAPAETMALQALQGPGARLPQRRWSGMRTKAAGDASKGLNVLEWTGKLVPQGALVTGAPLGRDRARARRDRFSWRYSSVELARRDAQAAMAPATPTRMPPCGASTGPTARRRSHELEPDVGDDGARARAADQGRRLRAAAVQLQRQDRRPAAPGACCGALGGPH
jgi:hypothetical protein